MEDSEGNQALEIRRRGEETRPTDLIAQDLHRIFYYELPLSDRPDEVPLTAYFEILGDEVPEAIRYRFLLVSTDKSLVAMETERSMAPRPRGSLCYPDQPAQIGIFHASTRRLAEFTGKESPEDYMKRMGLVPIDDELLPVIASLLEQCPQRIPG